MKEHKKPSASVLINSYNYRQYLGEALASALAQTLAPLEVIVVDDGSTDGTVEWLRSEVVPRDSRIRVITQANAGQLSAIETAVAAAVGDILFFLDADDTWEPDYLAAVYARFTERNDVDYIFSGHVRSDGRSSEVLCEKEDRILGKGSALAYATGRFAISITSTVAMRSTLARKFLPTTPSLISDWKTDADQVLALGAALAGGGCQFLAARRVNYRIHGANNFAGRVRPRNSATKLARRQRIGRAHDALIQRLQLKPTTVYRIVDEFATIERPTFREFRRALRTAAMAPLLFGRIKSITCVCSEYLNRLKFFG